MQTLRICYDMTVAPIAGPSAPAYFCTCCGITDVVTVDVGIFRQTVHRTVTVVVFVALDAPIQFESPVIVSSNRPICPRTRNSGVFYPRKQDVDEIVRVCIVFVQYRPKEF